MLTNQKKHTKFSLNDTLNQYGYVTSVSGGIAEARGILNIFWAIFAVFAKGRGQQIKENYA